MFVKCNSQSIHILFYLNCGEAKVMVEVRLGLFVIPEAPSKGCGVC